MYSALNFIKYYFIFCCCILQVSRGKTLYCASHGGGNRCKAAQCFRYVQSKCDYCNIHSASNPSDTENKSEVIRDNEDV